MPLDAACATLLPSASGTLTLSTAVAPAAWDRLEIRLAPASGEHTPFRQSHPLDEISFPFDYFIGGASGRAATPDWTLTAFLTRRAEPGDEPTSEEPAVRLRLEYPCNGCNDSCLEVSDTDLLLLEPTTCGASTCDSDEYCLVECLCCGIPDAGPPRSREECRSVPDGCSADSLCDCPELGGGICEPGARRVMRPCA